MTHECPICGELCDCDFPGEYCEHWTICSDPDDDWPGDEDDEEDEN